MTIYFDRFVLRPVVSRLGSESAVRGQGDASCPHWTALAVGCRPASSTHSLTVQVDM
jgi:hypothetical protein